MSDYNKAFEAWSLFHSKLTPSDIFTVTNPWPLKWQYAGRVIITFYSSDKWQEYGKYQDYYHDHGKSVGCWQPAGSNSWLRDGSFPIKNLPSDAAVLGYSGGWIIEQVGTGEILQAYPSKKSLLCCFPDRKTLFCLDRKHGVVAIFYGSGLKVEDRGIVG